MLVYMDGFDHYAAPQLVDKWTNVNNTSLGSPGRLGYGNYAIVQTGGGTITRGIPTVTSVIVGFAYFYNSTSFANATIFTFDDNFGSSLSTIGLTASGQLTGPGGAISAPGIMVGNTWCFIECSVTFSNTTTGSATIRLNGVTVATVSGVATASNSNGCSLLGPLMGSAPPSNCYYDDLYVLNTTAPNNAFLGDVKIYPLYPNGNGRVSGFTRFGGTSSGNYTAVNEVPPDYDVSYVYANSVGVADAYTLTTLSNVTTVLATQVCAFARKDDTPSKSLGLGVGNGTTENYDSGHSLNTSYSYVLRQMDTNPLTSAAWAVSDFTTLQLAQKIIV